MFAGAVDERAAPEFPQDRHDPVRNHVLLGQLMDRVAERAPADLGRAVQRRKSAVIGYCAELAEVF